MGCFSKKTMQNSFIGLTLLMCLATCIVAEDDSAMIKQESQFFDDEALVEDAESGIEKSSNGDETKVSNKIKMDILLAEKEMEPDVEEMERQDRKPGEDHESLDHLLEHHTDDYVREAEEDVAKAKREEEKAAVAKLLAESESTDKETDTMRTEMEATMPEALGLPAI